MNEFYKVTEFIKDRLDNNEFVNTKIFGAKDNDVYKKSIYPLVHVIPLGVKVPTNNAKTFTFEIAALDIRDISKGKEDDKYIGNDNLIDNLNLTSDILSDLILHFRGHNNIHGIELKFVSDLQPILYKSHHLLDGFTMNIELTIPNNQSSC